MRYKKHKQFDDQKKAQVQKSLFKKIYKNIFHYVCTNQQVNYDKFQKWFENSSNR